MASLHAILQGCSEGAFIKLPKLRKPVTCYVPITLMAYRLDCIKQRLTVDDLFVVIMILGWSAGLDMCVNVRTSTSISSSIRIRMNNMSVKLCLLQRDVLLKGFYRV